VPAALLCFAGMTKSAQFPFSSWLLGAMVAPTPVSALLHSSTMVKAGVYLVLRMAPVITGSGVGLAVALIGSGTFLLTSIAAITANDAKKVLAYSTIANLGLIVLCGGIGTSAAIWAGVLLIIFHALAKCLLFLCVGIVEHKLHSRDIEAMSGLLLKLPRLGIMMLIGMAGMFLAPFGMLISKWAVLTD
jgi:ech hydrogenase subunit A